jgi:dihydrofolate reductase
VTRRLSVNTFATLDGVMQAPGGPGEDPTGGFTHGGWSVNFWDDVMGQTMGEFMGKPFDLLLGRKTYEIFAAHWPYIEDEAAQALNAAQKYVASRTLKSLEWQNSTLLEGDAGRAVAKLKQVDGPDIQVHGSSNLSQTLLKEGLIDELQIWTFPVVLGTGKRLFGEGTVPSALKLIDSKTATTGVLITRYQPAGDIPYGTFQMQNPSEAELKRREKVTREG